MDELAAALEVAGSEAGLIFSSRPTLSTSADSSMAENDVQVFASFSLGEVSETQGMQMGAADKNPGNNIPDNSFLILHGAEVIPLDQSVINMGRRLDNHVVIDDPRISRNHAQIRAVKGHFVVFDLNSTGGTFVNRDRINQSILYPGDVISLAGVTLIFGQDLPPSQLRQGSTRPNSSVSSDRPTTVFPKEDKPAK